MTVLFVGCQEVADSVLEMAEDDYLPQVPWAIWKIFSFAKSAALIGIFPLIYRHLPSYFVEVEGHIVLELSHYLRLRYVSSASVTISAAGS